MKTIELMTPPCGIPVNIVNEFDILLSITVKILLNSVYLNTDLTDF